MTDALINKYRPKIWREFVGNGAAIDSIITSLQERNVHLYLLTGPSGCGKTTGARIIASELGCRKPIELDAAKNNSVDDTRAIIDELKFRPILGEGVKVFIIDECHALSKAAWTSLLKSIEEPPPWVYWVLCTTEPSRVLPTVKTRAFQVAFQRLHVDDLFDLLSKISKAEDFNTTDAILDICAANADGSPRQAINNLAKCWDQSVDDAVRLLQSAGESNDAVDLVKALIDNKPWPTLKNIILKLEETNPESVRRVIQAYITKIMLGTDDTGRLNKLIPILDAFSAPFPDEGMSPVLLAVCRVAFASYE